MNNPLLLAAIGSIFRWLLAIAAGHLVALGIWTETDAETYVTALAGAAAMGLVSLAWSLVQKVDMHDLLERAIELPKGVDPRLK